MLSLEVLTMAGRVARASGRPLEVVAIGPQGAAAAGILSSYGVSRLHVADDPRLAEYAPAAWGHALADLADQLNPEILIGTASDRGGEVMAHVGARMTLPMAANCTEVATGAFALVLDDKDFRVRLVPQVEADTGKISLAQARVVVGGGRGVGSAEGFASLEELADLLGGTVGCSRAVTSLGWRPHSDQVGQTGTRIAPDLYIACGISGAIQHMVGCRAAKHILAINTDAAAPIVAQADYAVIGDVQTVLRAVNAEIRRVKAGEPSRTPA